jgi:hypothetical protein
MAVFPCMYSGSDAPGEGAGQSPEQLRRYIHGGHTGDDHDRVLLFRGPQRAGRVLGGPRRRRGSQ